MREDSHSPPDDAAESRELPTTSVETVASPNKKPKQRIQFGLLELQGLLIALAVYYWVFIQLVYQPPYRRYPPEPPPAPLEARLVAMALSAGFSGVGSLATALFFSKRQVTGAWKRLGFQMLFTFVVVPGVMIGTVLLIAFLMWMCWIIFGR